PDICHDPGRLYAVLQPRHAQELGGVGAVRRGDQPDDGLDVRGCGRWPGSDPTNLVDRRREHLGSEEGPFDLTPVDDPDVVRVRQLSRLAGSDDNLMAAVETRVRDEPDRVRRGLTKG